MASSTWCLASRPGWAQPPAYFSDNRLDVEGRNTTHSLGSPPYSDFGLPHDYYVGFPDPSLPACARASLVPLTTYYWCVDESDGTDTWFGDVWSFRVMPQQAWDPSPTDGEELVSINGTMTWNKGDVDPGPVVSYNIYISADEAAVASVPTGSTTLPYITSVPGTSYRYSSLAVGTQVFWRVDTVLMEGPPFFTLHYIEGDVWSFTTHPRGLIYVQAGVSGANDGSSWQNAFIHLQDALTVAREGCEILAAQGTYKPDQGSAITLGDRNAAFQLKRRAKVAGGYAGYGEPDPDARDVDAYKTILSGDIGVVGDDSDNSYNVLHNRNIDHLTVLDGFTITGGVRLGVAMYNEASSPQIVNCTFAENSGVAMVNWESSPRVINCTFTGNAGSGMYNEYSAPAVVNSIFTGNSSYYGGGMDNFGSGPKVVNCLFNTNFADYGGGMSNLSFSSPAVINCTFSGNTASSSYGVGIYNHENSPSVVNCILWDKSPEEISDVEGSVSNVSFSVVQGGWPGTGNIDADPLYVDANGSDNISGTGNNNLHLLPYSRCIDAGHPTLDYSGQTDIDGQQRVLYDRVDIGADEVFPIAGDIDRDGDVDFDDYAYFCGHWLKRVLYDRVDMGADEVFPIAGDIDRDGDVDFDDYAYFCGHWLKGK